MDEILSRGEADALLGIVDDAPSDVIADDMPGDELGAETAARTIGTRAPPVAFDLSGAPRLTPGAHTALRRIATSWARGVREPLAELLRTDVEVRCTEMAPTCTIEAFERVPRPSWLHILSLAPLDARGLLVLDPSLALAVVDRLLGGGKGEGDDVTDAAPPPPRELSAIEEKIAGRLSDRLLAGLGAAFQDTVRGLRVRSVHREPEPCAATTVFAPGEGLVRFSLAIEGGLSGSVTALLPLGPLEEQLRRSRGRSASGAKDAGHRSGTVRDHLDAMRLEVSAVLSELELTVRELLSLRPNDIVTLGPRASTRARVLVEGVHKFDGRLGARNGRLAVRLVAGNHDPASDCAAAPPAPQVHLVGPRSGAADPAQAA